MPKNTVTLTIKYDYGIVEKYKMTQHSRMSFEHDFYRRKEKNPQHTFQYWEDGKTKILIDLTKIISVKIEGATE